VKNKPVVTPGEVQVYDGLAIWYTYVKGKFRFTGIAQIDYSTIQP
jgi:hypothetical protein